LAGAKARAEFTVGAEVPAFSLRTSDGRTISIERDGEAIQLKLEGESSTPPVLAVHLLQPDCLQCRMQLKALQVLHERFRSSGLAVLGVSHRGDERALADVGRELGITFPLAVGTGSELAQQFAAGDTFALIDRRGVVRFAQVGYGAGDEDLWAENVERMLAGEAPSKETVDRERLRTGDRWPAVTLPVLRSGKPMELVSQGGQLLFRDDEGKETQPKAAVGFFSRY